MPSLTVLFIVVKQIPLVLFVGLESTLAGSAFSQHYSYFFSECGLSLKERRKMAIFASTGNVNTTILNVSNTYLDQ